MFMLTVYGIRKNIHWGTDPIWTLLIKLLSIKNMLLNTYEMLVKNKGTHESWTFFSHDNDIRIHCFLSPHSHSTLYSVCIFSWHCQLFLKSASLVHCCYIQYLRYHFPWIVEVIIENRNAKHTIFILFSNAFSIFSSVVDFSLVVDAKG